MMYELSEDNAVADNEVCPCSSCGQPFAMSELRPYIVICHVMGGNGAGSQTFRHDYLRCSDCITGTAWRVDEEKLQKARGLLLLKREQEKKEAEERKALYLRILSQNQQASENEN